MCSVVAFSASSVRRRSGPVTISSKPLNRGTGTTRVERTAQLSVETAARTAAGFNQLVAEMRAGRQQALEQLYEATVGKVFGLALRILRNQADAEEVVCDTYEQAWSQADRFDPTRANAIGWLMMLCRSRALDRLRKQRVDAGAVDVDAIAELADETPHSEELLSMLQEGTRVHIALSTLRPDRQRLLRMAFLKGMTHEEIAAETGIPLGTVKSHVRRALLEVRDALS